MRSFAALLTLTLSIAAQAQVEPSLPLAIGRADLFNTRIGGSVLVIDTPEKSDYLAIVVAPESGDPIKNETLVQKTQTPGFETVANVYNVSVSSNKKGLAKVANWKDMGNSLWQTTYTIMQKDGKYVIAGLDYSYSYQEKGNSCSMNFLTGDAIIGNGKHKKVAPQVIDFAKATDVQVLESCQTLLGIR